MLKSSKTGLMTGLKMKSERGNIRQILASGAFVLEKGRKNPNYFLECLGYGKAKENEETLNDIMTLRRN